MLQLYFLCGFNILLTPSTESLYNYRLTVYRHFYRLRQEKAAIIFQQISSMLVIEINLYMHLFFVIECGQDEIKT